MWGIGLQNPPLGKFLAFVIAALIVSLFIGGGYVLSRGDGGASVTEDPPAGNDGNLSLELVDGEPNLVIPARRPGPDEATSRVEGLAALREMESMKQVLDVIATHDVMAIIGLFQLQTLSCASLGRGAGENCQQINGEVDGQFQAVTMEDGGRHFWFAVVRIEPLLEVIMAAGEPKLVLATRDDRTSSDEAGTYYLAFVVDEFDASNPIFGKSPDTVGSGFGLKIIPNAGHPIAEFSLLSPGWNPLDWLKWNGAPHHVRLFPKSPGLPATYDELRAE